MTASRWPAAIAVAATCAAILTLLFDVAPVLPTCGALAAVAALAARAAGVPGSRLEAPALVLMAALLLAAAAASSPVSASAPYLMWLVVAVGFARTGALDSARAWAVAGLVAGGATIAAYTALVRVTDDGASRLIVYPAVSHWGHYPEIGVLTAVVIALVVPVLLRTGRPAPKISAGVLTVVIAIGLVTTFARASWVAAMAGCAVAAWPHRRRPLALLAVVALAGLLVASQVARARVVTHDVTLGDAASTRQQAWVAGLSLWRMRPLTGWGPGQYRAAYALTYGADRRPAAETAHNFLLQVGVESGLVGLLAFCWLGLRLIEVVTDRLSESAGPVHAVGLAAASTVLAVRVMFDVLEPTASGLRVFVLSAIVVGLAGSARPRHPA